MFNNEDQKGKNQENLFINDFRDDKIINSLLNQKRKRNKIESSILAFEKEKKNLKISSVEIVKDKKERLSLVQRQVENTEISKDLIKMAMQINQQKI